MNITSISKRCINERNTNGISYVYDICIDNSYSFSVPEEVYFNLSLYEKESISDEELEKIKKASNLTMAKAKALTYLSFKMRTANEVESKLLRDGFSLYTIGIVIKELIAAGYMNDELYVKKYIYDRIKLKPKSKNMLMYELKNKGIDEAIIADCLKELEVDDTLIAKDLVLKKFKNLNLSDMKAKRKVFSFLRYRGFGDSQIKSVIKQIVDDTKNEMP